MYRIGNEEIEAVRRVIESKQLFKVNNGPLQESVNAERELREMMGTDYAIIMTSGHAALASALVGLGVGPGDQVIIPADNTRDLEEIDPEARENLVFIPCKTADEVLSHALVSKSSLSSDFMNMNDNVSVNNTDIADYSSARTEIHTF